MASISLGRTSMPSFLIASLFWLGNAAQSSFSGAWYLVNVNSVVCPGSAGYAVINMTEPAATRTPHIFTVFRTTNQSVTLAFEVTDATGKVITDQKAGVSLAKTARRLGEASEANDLLDVSSAPPRQLSARRRGYSGGGSSYSSPRRRSGGSSYTAPRRRAAPAPAPVPAPQASSTVGASARRRGYTEPVSQRRRTAGYDNRIYSNPSNPAAGSYGYANQATAASNFGGRLPSSTPYGYTGANAYSGRTGSGTQIALAAGGGLLAGMLVGNLMSTSWTGYTKQEMLNMPCTSGSWTGLCSTCVTLHGAAKCAIQISPKIDATRDDLLNTGFIPADFTWPIQVNITSITGTDFDPSTICPPSDPGVQWTAPAMKQLFLTLTAMEELAGSPAATSSEGGGFFSSMYFAVLVALGFCCCCCGAGAFWMSRSKRRPDWESGTSSESDSDGYHVQGQAVAPGAFYPPGPGPAAAYGQNPYWQAAPAPAAGGMPPSGPYTSYVQGSPMAYPAAFQSGAGFPGVSQRGFMETAAPSGAPWGEVLRAADVIVDPNTGMVVGPWGECLAWAVAYEHQNPGWQDDPRFREGPAQQVIEAMVQRAPESMTPAIMQGAEILEESCHQAVRSGQPVPLINQRVM
mmetsp:Transcript_43797/g.81763  ORF Transcript_43797/g.81763 Transcript_43797/m.81763 type:complete len:631 (+) Transcript_43797:60-1952(+)